MIAALEYDVVLDELAQAKHDAVTSDGRKVQIKATFKNSLTFRTVPEYYLGFKLYPDGQYEEIFNGPGQVFLTDTSAERASAKICSRSQSANCASYPSRCRSAIGFENAHQDASFPNAPRSTADRNGWARAGVEWPVTSRRAAID